MLMVGMLMVGMLMVGMLMVGMDEYGLSQIYQPLRHCSLFCQNCWQTAHFVDMPVAKQLTKTHFGRNLLREYSAA